MLENGRGEGQEKRCGVRESAPKAVITSGIESKAGCAGVCVVCPLIPFVVFDRPLAVPLTADRPLLSAAMVCSTFWSVVLVKVVSFSSAFILSTSNVELTCFGMVRLRSEQIAKD